MPLMESWEGCKRWSPWSHTSWKSNRF